jgi:hypothetical protein
MKELLLSLALVFTAAATAQADRPRPAAVNPAEAGPAGVVPELPVRGQIVCAFPDGDGGCAGAVTFIYEETRAPAWRPAPPARPAPSGASRRPALVRLHPRD